MKVDIKKIINGVVLVAGAISTAAQIVEGTKEFKETVKDFKKHKNEESQ